MLVSVAAGLIVLQFLSVHLEISFLHTNDSKCPSEFCVVNSVDVLLVSVTAFATLRYHALTVAIKKFLV